MESIIEEKRRKQEKNRKLRKIINRKRQSGRTRYEENDEEAHKRIERNLSQTNKWSRRRCKEKECARHYIDLQDEKQERQNKI